MLGWGFTPGIPAPTLMGKLRPTSGPHTVPPVCESFQTVSSFPPITSLRGDLSTMWMTLPDGCYVVYGHGMPWRRAMCIWRA